MKSKWIISSMFAALCIFDACSKTNSPDVLPPDTDPPTEVDTPKCLLSEVNYQYQPNMPYFRDPLTLTYDSLHRITKRQSINTYILYSYENGKVIRRMYTNSIAEANLTERYIYTLDNNDRIMFHTRNEYSSDHTSEEDYIRRDSTDYQYDAEGHLIGQKWYELGMFLTKEMKSTYQNGNMIRQENIYYEYASDPLVRKGADTLTYTYDNAAWFPEAYYLYEVGDPVRDIRTGKPNVNNVTSIQCKMFKDTTIYYDFYKSIEYKYAVKDQKLEKVTMTATTTNGYNINTTFGFGYKCD